MFEILSRDSETDGNEHVALNSPVQCASDFQFRDILVNSLWNFIDLSRSQSSDVANTREELEKGFKPGLNCVSS